MVITICHLKKTKEIRGAHSNLNWDHFVFQPNLTTSNPIFFGTNFKYPGIFYMKAIDKYWPICFIWALLTLWPSNGSVLLHTYI